MNITGGILLYVAGLALAPFLYDHELFRIAPFLFACIALIFRKNHLLPIVFALFLISFGLNQYYLNTWTNPLDHLTLEASESRLLRIGGHIDIINDRPDHGAYIDLDSVLVTDNGKSHLLNGKVRIFIDKMSTPLFSGDSIRLMTRLREPRNFQTPGAFDYKRHLRRRNIIATGFIRNSTDIARMHTDKSWNLFNAIKVWRDQVRSLINSSLPEASAPFVKALAIGDRGAMSDSQRKLLAQSGIAHLFAISGLHVGLVATLLYLALRNLYLRTLIHRFNIPARRILPPLLLPLLFGYMILTGTAISTTRAIIMLGTVAVLCLMSRRSRPIDILITAAFAILVFDPLALFEPSFQLSIAGAAGIILFLPSWSKRLEFLPVYYRYPLTLVAVTLSATITTWPFVLMHFHTLAPAGIVLNLAAVPLVSFILVPLTLVALLMSLIEPAAAIFCFKLIATIMDPFMTFVAKMVQIDFFKAQTVFLTPASITLILLIIICAGCIKTSSHKIKLIFIVLILGLTFTTWLSVNDHTELRVVAIDVGQGDATLLQTPNGKNYLIDGGGLYSERFDTGERLVAPALGYLGVDHLDAVILSHNHPDHVKGLAYILEHFSVNSFWSTTPAGQTDPLLIEPIRKNRIAVESFSPGWHQADDNNLLKIYVPANSSTRINDQSMVLYARHGGDGLLLTGDLEQAGIKELTASADPGPVTLLKLPHHGSRKSDPSPLLQKFNPRFAFSSVGFNNRYGLPHPTVLNTLEKASIPLQRTDINGTIMLSSKGHGWGITHWKKGLFR